MITVVLGLMLESATQIQALWMTVVVCLAVEVRILMVLIWANSYRLGQLTADLVRVHCTLAGCHG
eukprot:SAG11_NODE_989_length_6272_cov_18.066256_2_plen_65_part_00